MQNLNKYLSVINWVVAILFILIIALENNNLLFWMGMLSNGLVNFCTWKIKEICSTKKQYLNVKEKQ